MILSQLSQDVLERLCFYLDGLDLGLLWLAGDSLMNLKLSTSVTHFVHKYAPYRPIVWPKVIAKCFKLKSLVLTASFGLHVQRVNLYDLPASVTELTSNLRIRTWCGWEWNPFATFRSIFRKTHLQRPRCSRFMNDCLISSTYASLDRTYLMSSCGSCPVMASYKLWSFLRPY